MASKKGRVPVKPSKVKSKKISLKYSVDCTTAVEDQLIVTGNLVDFLKQRIKVNNKTGNLGDHIHINKTDGKIIVTSNIPMSKRYLKYLTKKFLKKNNLRDFLRVISINRNDYELRYFNIAEESDEDSD